MGSLKIQLVLLLLLHHAKEFCNFLGHSAWNLIKFLKTCDNVIALPLPLVLWICCRPQSGTRSYKRPRLTARAFTKILWQDLAGCISRAPSVEVTLFLKRSGMRERERGEREREGERNLFAWMWLHFGNCTSLLNLLDSSSQSYSERRAVPSITCVAQDCCLVRTLSPVTFYWFWGVRMSESPRSREREPCVGTPYSGPTKQKWVTPRGVWPWGNK